MKKVKNSAGEDPIIGIMGLGYVGLPLAVEFSKIYQTIGYDLDKKRINQLKKGNDKTNEIKEKHLLNKKLFFTSSINDLYKCNTFIVTVPTPITKDKKPDLTFLKRASEMTGKHLTYIAEQSLLITNQVSKLPSDKNLLVNVNFPDLPSSKIKGARITSLGKRGVPDTPDLIRTEDYVKFYSFGPSGKLLPNQVDTDIQAIEDNFISISILDYNLSVDASNWNYYREVFDCE